MGTGGGGTASTPPSRARAVPTRVVSGAPATRYPPPPGAPGGTYARVDGVGVHIAACIAPTVPGVVVVVDARCAAPSIVMYAGHAPDATHGGGGGGGGGGGRARRRAFASFDDMSARRVEFVRARRRVTVS